MLHLVLTVLKILGIIILILVGVLLLAAVSLLFVPIRYRVEGKKEDGELWVKVKLSWLFRLVRAWGVYPEPGRTIVKVLFFTVFDSDAAPKEKKTKKKLAQNSRRDGKKTKPEPENKKAESAGAKPTLSGNEGENRQETAEGGTESTQKKTEPVGDEIKTSGIFSKIKALFEKIKQIFRNISYTIRRLCDKIKMICSNIAYYKEVFSEEETKKVLHLCKEQFQKVWKHIKPQKFKAELHFGTGEPDTTGSILAVHGILYPYLGNNVTIVPDFENRILEGTVFAKGRLTVWTLLSVALKIYFDKNIRYFYKRLKREE